jgi:hypothetical protein
VEIRVGRIVASFNEDGFVLWIYLQYIESHARDCSVRVTVTADGQRGKMIWLNETGLVRGEGRQRDKVALLPRQDGLRADIEDHERSKDFALGIEDVTCDVGML